MKVKFDGRDGVRIHSRDLGVAAQVEIEAKTWNQLIIRYFQFQALCSRRFQLGFHRVNLHRLTLAAGAAEAAAESGAPSKQGLRLVHFSAQRKRIGGVFRG